MKKLFTTLIALTSLSTFAASSKPVIKTFCFDSASANGILSRSLNTAKSESTLRNAIYRNSKNAETKLYLYEDNKITLVSKVMQNMYNIQAVSSGFEDTESISYYDLEIIEGGLEIEAASGHELLYGELISGDGSSYELSLLMVS